LVDAIEAVSSGTTLAVAHVFEHLSHSRPEAPSEIIFESDVKDGAEFTVAPSFLERVRSAKQLQALLQELKEAI
jgi:hypothetical protein